MLVRNGDKAPENIQHDCQRVLSLACERADWRTAPINLHFVHPRAPVPGGWFAAANAFVQPSRCDPSGREIMSALRAGCVVIAPSWGHLADLIDPNDGYALDHAVVPVPASALASFPVYSGCCWAEPSRDHLAHLLTRVLDGHEPVSARVPAEEDRGLRVKERLLELLEEAQAG